MGILKKIENFFGTVCILYTVFEHMLCVRPLSCYYDYYIQCIGFVWVFHFIFWFAWVHYDSSTIEDMKAW